MITGSILQVFTHRMCCLWNFAFLLWFKNVNVEELERWLSACCSSRRPKSSSQHPCQACPDHLLLQLQRIKYFLWLGGHPFPRNVHISTIKYLKKRKVWWKDSIRKSSKSDTFFLLQRNKVHIKFQKNFRQLDIFPKHGNMVCPFTYFVYFNHHHLHLLLPRPSYPSSSFFFPLLLPLPPPSPFSLLLLCVWCVGGIPCELHFMCGGQRSTSWSWFSLSLHVGSVYQMQITGSTEQALNHWAVSQAPLVFQFCFKGACWELLIWNA